MLIWLKRRCITCRSVKAIKLYKFPTLNLHLHLDEHKSTKLDSTVHCLQCVTPSKDKSVIDNLNLSFSQPKIEKSDSTDAVFGNTVAIPPQKSLKILNRPSTIAHAVSNDLIETSS